MLAVLALAPSVAQATFPGANGRIAFASDRGGDYDIWVMNPDGSRPVRLTEGPPSDVSPAWSADGHDIAFTRGGRIFRMDAGGGGERRVSPQANEAYSPTWSPDGSKIAYEYFTISVIDAEGQGSPTQVSHIFAPENDGAPDWSPDGNAIAFHRDYAAGSRDFCTYHATLRRVDPAGATESPITTDISFVDLSPSYSPNGETIVFSRQRDPCTVEDARNEHTDIYSVAAGGGAAVQLTHTPDIDEGDPVWSPDGTKIAFVATVGGNTDIYVMNADGTGQQRITTDPGRDIAPAWQSGIHLPPGYARPKAALEVNVPLVPKYAECTDPNRTHGPSLASASCSPPRRQGAIDETGPFATFGTPDANGYPTRSIGRLRFHAIVGNPATEADEADVRIRLNVTDVRDAAEPSAPYPWSLTVPLPLRITDKREGCCAMTVRDLNQYSDTELQIEAPCAPAEPGAGATCSVTTTADTVAPGLVREGGRSLWDFVRPVTVFDSGADGLAFTADDNAPLATQGIFVP